MINMDCTVVIPTYNRPLHLNRILQYYNSYGSGLAVIVADSGSAENRKQDAQIISSLSNLSIHHLDLYDVSVDPWHKILDAVQHVNTKYCLICADDDFVTPRGIKAAKDFLDLNPDYISAYGNNIWFSIKEGEGGKPAFLCKYFQSQANLQPDPQKRLLNKAMDSSNITYYAVHRTSFMQLLIGEASRITGDLRFAGAFRLTPDLFFAELLILWLPSIHGKMKCLDTLYYVREDCTPQNVSRLYVTLPDIMNEASYKPKLHEFTACVAAHLSEQTGMAQAEAQKIVEKAIVIYNRRTPSIVLGINSVLNKLHLPIWLDLAIRKVYRFGSALLYPPTGSGHVFPERYDDELDKIRLAVLSSAAEVYGIGN